MTANEPQHSLGLNAVVPGKVPMNSSQRFWKKPQWYV